MEMAEKSKKPTTKSLWHILRAVYYMYKGIAKHKFNLRLFLERSKTVAFSCRYGDSTKSFYTPREVEFSCSNTPYQFLKRKKRYHHASAKAVAEAFEFMNSKSTTTTTESSCYLYNGATPSPTGNVRQLRITDSPFPLKEEEEEGEMGKHVDKEAEDFILKFYQQLRSQMQEPLLGRV